MTLLLVHVSLLLLLCHAASRRLVAHVVDGIVATALLFWGNIVTACLLLSWLGHLNDSTWFFRTSLLLGLALLVAVRRWAVAERVTAEPDGGKRSPWLIAAAAVTLLAMLAANLAIAATYEPNNYDTMTYHLPRVMYYLGHNSLAHFETADFRQVYYPFNFNLLQLLCLVYWAPLQTINFFDVATWVVVGLGVYRVARLCGCSFNGSLIAAWLTCTSTEILAQATSTILDLPTAAAFVSALVFALRWRTARRGSDALLAGLALSLSAGTKLTVIFFGPAMVLLFVVLFYQHWRRQETSGFVRGTRAWVGPALLAAALCAPFLLYNLRATGELMTHRMDFTLNKPFNPFCALQTGYGYLVQLFCEPLGRFTFDLGVIDALNQWFARTVFKHWNDAYAFSELYTILPDLTEDHVFFGFAGPLFLVCAIICFWRDPKLRQPVSWVGLLGLGWFLTYFAMNKYSLYNQRYFVPAIVVMGPCAAAVWDARSTGSRWFNHGGRLVFGLVALCGLWFSLHYLVENHIRPTPLPFRAQVAPRSGPILPPTLVERLPGQPRVNVYSYGTNERIFPLMHLGPRQFFTSGLHVDPDRYNLFSFWGNTRNHIYSNLAYFASYTVVPVSAKRTAGVEFLGTMAEYPDPFDYLGLPPHANDTSATPQNSNIAVLVDYNANTNDPIRIDGARLRVFGLNPRDGADVRISAEMRDGTTLPLLAAASAEWSYLSVKQPIKRLIIEVVSQADGRHLGLGEIPFTVRINGIAAPLVGSAGALFASELISGEPPRNLSVSGLDTMEGPYPQWDLPVFRWAKKPVVRIVIPADAKRDRIRLTFSVRLHVRETASLEVLHNGKKIQSFALQGSTAWHNELVEVAATPGENVIELRDCSTATGQVPDWLAYLEQNPDVKAYVTAQGQALEEGAQWHYEAHGRTEGRALPTRPGTVPAPPPPDSLYFAFRSLRVEGFTAR
jgi:TM2 domain-containing membrane protein YozV